MTGPRTNTEKNKAKAKVKKVATGKKKKTGANGAAHPANNAQPAAAGNRPIIRMNTGEHSDIVNLTETMLIEAGAPLYQRGASLVRPVISEVDASHGRRTKVAQLAQLSSIYLRDLMCRHCDFYRFDKRAGDWVRALAPIAVANTLRERNGDWNVPTLVGVISCPTLRPDGSLLATQGFDPATQLLLVEPPAMPPIRDKPTRKDAIAALKLLKNLLTEFPFVDKVSGAVALCGIITPVVRGALPVMAAGANEEELEKRLGASLLAGQPLISIDNVNGELGGDALCQAIERPIVDVRILGKSEKVRIEARGTTLFCTGNNITLVGDLCRRAITSTLDPEMERPELRQFKHDPVGMVLEDRGKYIAAALTIVRAYIVAGRPDPAAKLASFEGWSDNVRSALVWCGEDDPVISMEAAHDEDPQRAELADMISVWADEFDVGYDHRVTLSSLIEQAEETMQTFNGFEPKLPELLTILQQITQTKRGQKLNILTLGRWVRTNKGRIINGMRFANESNPKGGSTWWIEKVKPATTTTTEGV